MIDDYNILARAWVTMATTVPRTAKKQQVVVPSSWTRSVFENRDFFSPVWPMTVSCPHVSSENTVKENPTFQKRSPECMKIFESAVLLYSFGWEI